MSKNFRIDKAIKPKVYNLLIETEFNQFTFKGFLKIETEIEKEVDQ